MCEVMEGSEDHPLHKIVKGWPNKCHVCRDINLSVCGGCLRTFNLLRSIVLTACLFVHKREARERRERNPKSPAAFLLAALVKGLLWRKPKFLIKIRPPFMHAHRSQLCSP